MAFTLNHVVPWGRSFDEYERMFALTAEDLERPILGCGDGPASFNAEATRRGARVTSVDPLYAYSGAEISARIEATYDEILAQTRRNQHEFVWAQFLSVEELGQARMRAMHRFLADYDAGRQDGRYLAAELPVLPFADRSFELVVCSHLLFLYSDQLGEPFHVASVTELCRVANEVRLFPLVELGGAPSPHVAPVVRGVERLGWKVTIEVVPYEFQRGAKQMLRIQRPASC